MATVLCTRDSDFGYLLKEDYDTCLKSIYKADTDRRRHFFYKTVFKSLAPAGIISKLTFEFYKKKVILERNQCILKQGERVRFVSVIRHGQVRIEKTERVLLKPSRSEMERPVVQDRVYNLGYLGEGEFLCENFIFSNLGSEYTLRVSSQTITLLQVPVESLRTYMNIDSWFTDFFRKLVEVRKIRRTKTLNRMKDVNIQKRHSKSTQSVSGDLEESGAKSMRPDPKKP